MYNLYKISTKINLYKMYELVEKSYDFTKEESDILDEFHSVTFKIIKLAKKLDPNNIEIEVLHKKLSLAKSIDPLIIIDKCKDKIWFYRNEIINRDIDFFVKNKFSQFIKNDENKTFMYSLINMFKKKMMELSNAELKAVWDLINDLLVAVVKYLKIRNEKD